MRSHLPRLIAAAGLAACALTACGGDDDDAGDAQVTATSTETGADVQVDDADDATAATADVETTEAAPSGDVDCSSLTSDDIGVYIVSTQLLAQVSGQDQVEMLREQSFGNYTPEAFAAVLAKLHVLLDGQEGEVFGDPTESLDFYEGANEIVGRMIASPDPVPQELFDEYTAYIGDVAAMINKQLPINATLSEVCPDLEAMQG